MKKIIAAGTFALCLPTFAYADFIGFRVGATSWQQDFEGSVQSGPDVIDVDNVLGIQDETNNSFYIALEHPVPLLPNIALTRTDIDVEESNTIDDGFVFDGVPFLAGSDVTTVADLSHTDLTLYYELLDNWVAFDIGVTVRKFDEGISLSYQPIVDGPILSASEDLDDALPLLYVAAKFELPLTGLYVGGDINAIKYSGDSFIDYKLNIGYETDFGLGAELGFRSLDIDYNESSLEKADLTIDGGYASIFYHF